VNVLYEYIGVLHVHSTHSDGTLSVPDIAHCAEQVGLDFLVIHDHMTLGGLPEQGWYGGTLVIVGCEIHDREKRNHYLAFGLSKIPDSQDPQQYIDAVNRVGGFGFIAHPYDVRRRFVDQPSYPWTRWDVDGYQGIEIWNYMSQWMGSVWRFNTWYRVLFPDRSVGNPRKAVLELWDKLSRDRKTVGIAGADAHALAKKWGPFRFVLYPYRTLFSRLRTHVLLDRQMSGDAAADSERVLVALREGRCFVSNRRWGDGYGFRFWAERGGNVAQMGDEIELGEGVTFGVALPEEGEIALLLNGEVFEKAWGCSLKTTVRQPGAYRVEVRRRRRTWILSNHIRVMSPAK
jgi:hypothetical protein